MQAGLNSLENAKCQFTKIKLVASITTASARVAVGHIADEIVQVTAVRPGQSCGRCDGAW